MASHLAHQDLIEHELAQGPLAPANLKEPPALADLGPGGLEAAPRLGTDTRDSPGRTRLIEEHDSPRELQGTRAGAASARTQLNLLDPLQAEGARRPEGDSNLARSRWVVKTRPRAADLDPRQALARRRQSLHLDPRLLPARPESTLRWAHPVAARMSRAPTLSASHERPPP